MRRATVDTWRGWQAGHANQTLCARVYTTTRNHLRMLMARPPYHSSSSPTCRVTNRVQSCVWKTDMRPAVEPFGVTSGAVKAAPHGVTPLVPLAAMLAGSTHTSPLRQYSSTGCMQAWQQARHVLHEHMHFVVWHAQPQGGACEPR